MQKHISKMARIFKAVCDENRIRILMSIKDEPKGATKLLEELNVSQPTLSHHMHILCNSGIVNSSKSGRNITYSINEKGMVAAASFINEFLDK